MGGANQSFSTSLQKNLIATKNMKKRFIIPCILLSFIATSQSDSLPKKKIVYGTSINQSLTRYGFPTALLFTVQYDKHEFSLGPQFRVGRSFTPNQKNLGLEFNYRCYLAGDEHWFSSFVLFNLGYFHEYSAYNTYVSSPSNPTAYGQPVKRSEAFDNIALNLGYGVKFRLGWRLYLGSNIGIGYLSSLYTAKTRKPTGEYINNSKSHDGYLGFVSSVYLGFNFNR